ncbi:MAG: hypothetical protein IKP73_15740 [Bacteroidales bacterium]|nr:hypothetical protein [Bacteroidales bacterium]
MIREAILAALERQNMTKNHLGVEADVDRQSLFRFLSGDTTLGLKSVEAVFRVLSINVVKADGSFFYYGYDLGTAVKRGMTERKMLVRDMCAAAGITQPCLNEFLQGRAKSRPATVERMLTALGLSLAEIQPPARLPRLKGTERRERAAFPIGYAVWQALKRKGITPYAFAKEIGFNNGGFTTFLKSGTASLGSAATERIFGLLDMHITDGDGTDYGSDIRAAVRGAMERQGTNCNALAVKMGFSRTLVYIFLNRGINIATHRLSALFKELGLTVK